MYTSARKKTSRRNSKKKTPNVLGTTNQSPHCAELISRHPVPVASCQVPGTSYILVAGTPKTRHSEPADTGASKVKHKLLGTQKRITSSWELDGATAPKGFHAALTRGLIDAHQPPTRDNQLAVALEAQAKPGPHITSVAFNCDS